MANVLTRHNNAEISTAHIKKPPLEARDWIRLNRGDSVYVRRENQVLLSGAVDDIAPDGSIFWMWIDSGGGRIALHKDDDISVWLPDRSPARQKSARSKGPATALKNDLSTTSSRR